MQNSNLPYHSECVSNAYEMILIDIKISNRFSCSFGKLEQQYRQQKGLGKVLHRTAKLEVYVITNQGNINCGLMMNAQYYY